MPNSLLPTVRSTSFVGRLDQRTPSLGHPEIGSNPHASADSAAPTTRGSPGPSKLSNPPRSGVFGAAITYLRAFEKTAREGLSAVLPSRAPRRRADQTLNDETIAATGMALGDPKQRLERLEGKDHHLIVASSEGGLKSTTDIDDPEGIRRIAVALQMLPPDERARTTFVAYVNTSRGEAGLNTRQAADDLVAYLVKAGIPEDLIQRELTVDPETGRIKPGIVVLYGDDEKAKAPSVGLPGSTRLAGLKIDDKTEVTALMMASPANLADLKPHNVAVVGNGRNATNDRYAEGQSKRMLEAQGEALTLHFADQGLSGEALQIRVAIELAARCEILDFEDAFANSLTAAERNRFHGADSAMPAEIKEAMAKANREKIELNTKYARGQINGQSPDAAYGNRTYQAAGEFLGIGEDDFKDDLHRTRQGMIDPALVAKLPNLPDFVHSTQLAALAVLSQKMLSEDPSRLDRPAVMGTLERAVGPGFDVTDSAKLRPQLLAYLQRPEVTGAKFAADGGEAFRASTATFSTDALATAVALHLKGIQKSLGLMFEHVPGDVIPASVDAANDRIEAHGGWDSMKIAEYDSVAAFRLLYPELDARNCICAVDLHATANR